MILTRDVERLFRTRRRRIAAVALSATIAIASLPLAWSQTGASPAASTAAKSHSGTEGKRETVSGIDALILHLHDSLKITPAQEQLWQQVAAVMRDNAATMTQLAKTRAENAGNRTALDDLKSYAEISEAHAEGTRKMIPVFETLYNSMSDEQKKAADVEFREHHRGRGHQA
jgi:LTXXQ motif family protein